MLSYFKQNHMSMQVWEAFTSERVWSHNWFKGGALGRTQDCHSYQFPFRTLGSIAITSITWSQMKPDQHAKSMFNEWRPCTAVPFVGSECALILVLEGFTPCRTTSWMMQRVMAPAGLKRAEDDPFKGEGGAHCKVDCLLFLNSEICGVWYLPVDFIRITFFFHLLCHASLKSQISHCKQIIWSVFFRNRMNFYIFLH